MDVVGLVDEPDDLGLMLSLVSVRDLLEPAHLIHIVFVVMVILQPLLDYLSLGV